MVVRIILIFLSNKILIIKVNNNLLTPKILIDTLTFNYKQRTSKHLMLQRMNIA